MITWIIIAALSYTFTGAWLWKTIILRDILTTDVTTCRTDAELLALCENQCMMQANESNGNFAHYVCKACFVVAWPAFILFGIINARLLDG